MSYFDLSENYFTTMRLLEKLVSVKETGKSRSSLEI